ncbi:hypothetical protein ACFE04_010225 [Oxalis oulophora]
MSPENYYLATSFMSHKISSLINLIYFLIILVSIFASPGGLAWALHKIRSNNRQTRTAIPGPSGLPVLGLVFAFTGTLTHQVLAKLAESTKSKSLMAFSIGFTRFVISSQPETAKELLNSSSFADRPIKESAYELMFHRAMGFAPFGEYWRNLRRISATHMFSPRKIACFGEFRQKIGLEMVDQIRTSMEVQGDVRLRRVLHFGSLNNVTMSVFGKTYDFTSLEGLELTTLVKEGYELLGIFNWSDHFPFLAWLDLQGVRKRCRKLVTKVNVFVGKIIEERRAKKRALNNSISGYNENFLDVLLDLLEESKVDKLSDFDMIVVLWEMVFRGTDTIAILLEWIMARMVLHPNIQAKAQAEIDLATTTGSVGTNRPISDSDLPNLPYLKSIVKETLRLHPPGPLLSWARLSIHDTTIGGQVIPAGTTAMVNMWAITHDEKVWTEANKFDPERFMKEDVAIMGSDLRLAPFGSGRRVCPGKSLGLATVELWLAQLLQSFKWVPCSNGNDVDLSETLKLSMEMKNSLVCKVVSRVYP